MILLDLTFLRKALSFRDDFFFSFFSNLSLVSFRSFVTLMNLCRRSLISWSFLCFTSLIDNTFLRSTQFSWICSFLISLSLSYSFFYKSCRFLSKNNSRSLRPTWLPLPFSISPVLVLHSEDYLLPLPSPFAPLMHFAISLFSSINFLFLSWRYSIWFCKFFKFVSDFWFIRASFRFRVSCSISWFALDRFRLVTSEFLCNSRTTFYNYFFSTRSLFISSPKFPSFSYWQAVNSCNLYLSSISSYNFFFNWENLRTSLRSSSFPFPNDWTWVR